MSNNRILISRLVTGSLVANDVSYMADVYYKLGRDEMLNFTKKKKIIPFAAKTFVNLDLDADYWNSILDGYRERNIKVIDFLEAAYKSAEEHGVKKMFVSENFGAMLAAGTDTGLFASGDVDNHAAPEECDRLFAAMRAIGCEIKQRYAKNLLIAAEFFPPKSFGLPDGFYMSVDFYPLARLKLPCFIDSEKFVAWDELYCYGNTHIKLAPPTALAYICMLHTSLHSFMRAPDHRLYVDLYNVFQLDVDYDKLAEWCKRDKTWTRAAVACRISNELMDTEFPKTITSIGRSDKLFNLVFNQQDKYLYPEPGRLTIMKVDVMCNDKSNLHGLYEILFPDKNWMKKVYGSSSIWAHLKHWKRVF